MDVSSPVATLALVAWPVIAWQLFARLDRVRALIWAILLPYLFLPPVVTFNFPVLPDFDKVSIPNLTAVLFVLFLWRERVPVLPASLTGRLLIGLFVLSPFATVAANDDPLVFRQAVIPGISLYDSVAMVTKQAIALIPFFLARRYLATPAAMRAILQALVIAGLIYSVPMLIEARVSPQLNVWVYGFFQHDFSQTIRMGGYRPIVFLQHGLWVALFALMAVIAATVAFREGPAALRPRQLMVLLYLMFVLAICRSLGPLVYAAAFLPLLFLLPPRWLVLVSAVVAAVVIAYPALRGAHLVPMDDILRLAFSVSEDRGNSLAFRTMNEEILLARAEERPWFGWGSFGRNLTHDAVTGRISAISDGHWIIVIGTFGWLGYIAEFGLLTLPLLLIAREVWRGAPVALPAAAVAVILAVNLLDLLPNATLIPFTWLICGALTGLSEAMAADRRAARAAAHARAWPAGRTVL